MIRMRDETDRMHDETDGMHEGAESVVLIESADAGMAEGAPVFKGRMLHFGDLWTLLRKPVSFFDGSIKLDSQPLLFIVLLVIGASNAIDRIDSELMQYATSGNGMTGSGELNPIVDLVVSYGWISFWVYAILFGAISAGIAWIINGWWYGKRLEWCSERNITDVDRRLGRMSFFYNQLIPSALSVLMAVTYTFRHGDYIEAYFEMTLLDSFGAFMVLVLMTISVVNSYRTVCGVFPMKKWPARIWFLMLPIAIYLVAIIGALSLFM